MLMINRKDIFIAILLGGILAVGSFYGSKLVPKAIFEKSHRDSWFQSASDSIYSLVSDREHSKHGRNNTHPFFSVTAHPAVYALVKVFNVDVIMALRMLTVIVAFLWGAALFLLLRLICQKTIEAVLFSLLAFVSSASMFFFVIPETFSFSSLSMLPALMVAIISQQYVLPYWSYLAVNFLTFSYASTNWLAGILVTFANFRFKEAVQLLANMFCLATILWGAQKLIYPTSKFFLDIVGETNFVNRPETGGPLHCIKSFIYHTLAAPAIRLVDNPNEGNEWPYIMSVQLSPPGSGEVWGLVAVILWTILLAVGVWALLTLKDHPKFRFVLGFLLLGQMGLHSFYGEETFLYSLHFIILLIPLVALGSLTRLRVAVIVIAMVLIPLTAINNFKQFKESLDMFDQLGASQHQNVANL